jgi:hypothetical protein
LIAVGKQASVVVGRGRHSRKETLLHRGIHQPNATESRLQALLVGHKSLLIMDRSIHKVTRSWGKGKGKRG